MGHQKMLLLQRGLQRGLRRALFVAAPSLALVPLRFFASAAAASSTADAPKAKKAHAPPSRLSNTEKVRLKKVQRLEKRKTVAQLIKVRSGPTFHLDEAIRIVRSAGRGSTLASTVALQLQLGVDPRRTDQIVRGVAPLPHGSGKRVVVAVFARGEKAEEARAAGADIVGDADLAARVAAGELPFTRVIATPDMMGVVGKVARVLGPRGLMPNPKMGTVTTNVREAVSAAKRGQADFRSEKRGIVHAPVGKASFSETQLKDNVRAMMLAVAAARPENFKGTFFLSAYLSCTHGPALPLTLGVVDPGAATFMSAWDGVAQHLEGGAGVGGVGEGAASVDPAAAAVAGGGGSGATELR